MVDDLATRAARALCPRLVALVLRLVEDLRPRPGQLGDVLLQLRALVHQGAAGGGPGQLLDLRSMPAWSVTWPCARGTGAAPAPGCGP